MEYKQENQSVQNKSENEEEKELDIYLDSPRTDKITTP
jgi:hypothetical protein